MSRPAIQVENLSKLYRIGERGGGYRTLRESLSGIAAAPFRRWFFRNGNHSRSPHAPRRASSSEQHIWALKDTSFEVPSGEVIGIIGRNGAGKSTLLKVLSRITEPTSGRARIRGRVASLLEVGTGFHPELTGRENVYLNGAILGMGRSEIHRKFDEIVDFADVEQFIDTPVKHYSSGMGVRLAFAVAAHLEPEILLVDEVLAVGDAAFQKKCIRKMNDVATGGRTVLFVSHNMLSIQSHCSRGILLDAGKIVMDGETNAVIQKYLEDVTENCGEVTWDSPENAPGDYRGRLRAARIVSEDKVTSTVAISRDFRIEFDYWNLQPNGRRLVSLHLHNSMGICVLSSGNATSLCVTPDPWYVSPYPPGLYRTSCTIPAFFLNDGDYSISLFLNGTSVKDAIVHYPEVLKFNVFDTGEMRQEYTGKWLGVVRPRLDWMTSQLGQDV